MNGSLSLCPFPLPSLSLFLPLFVFGLVCMHLCVWMYTLLCVLVGSRQTTAPASVTAAAAAVAAAAGTTAGLVEQGSTALWGPVPLPPYISTLLSLLYSSCLLTVLSFHLHSCSQCFPFLSIFSFPLPFSSI